MLQGIVNISANTDHSEVKRDYKLHGKHRAFLAEDTNNDFISVSPAFKYLAKLNWKVQAINAKEKEKILISFSVLDFMFRITLDLRLLPHLNKVFFEVKKNIENKNIILILSVPFSISETESADQLSLNNLEILFSRLNYLTRTREIGPSDSRISYGLYEDLEQGLRKEFKKILFALLIFAEKLTSQKILEQVNLINSNNPFETIRLENVEVC